MKALTSTRSRKVGLMRSCCCCTCFRCRSLLCAVGPWEGWMSTSRTDHQTSRAVLHLRDRTPTIQNPKHQPSEPASSGCLRGVYNSRTIEPRPWFEVPIRFGIRTSGAPAMSCSLTSALAAGSHVSKKNKDYLMMPDCYSNYFNVRCEDRIDI
jgi:hypothetical protein